MWAFKMIHIKPMPGKQILKILLEYFIRIHFFILVLKAFIISEDFI